MKKQTTTMKELLSEHRAGKKFSCYDTHDRELVDRLLVINRSLRKEIDRLTEERDAVVEADERSEI